MNLWGHRFSQNANQKLSRFLPYPLINFHGRNFGNFWLAFWEKRWPHKFILNLTDLCLVGQKNLVCPISYGQIKCFCPSRLLSKVWKYFLLLKSQSYIFSAKYVWSRNSWKCLAYFFLGISFLVTNFAMGF